MLQPIQTESVTWSPKANTGPRSLSKTMWQSTAWSGQIFLLLLEQRGVVLYGTKEADNPDYKFTVLTELPAPAGDLFGMDKVAGEAGAFDIPGGKMVEWIIRPRLNHEPAFHRTVRRLFPDRTEPRRGLGQV